MRTIKILMTVVTVVTCILFELWYGFTYMLPFLIEFGDKNGDVMAFTVATITFLFRVLLYTSVVSGVAYLCELTLKRIK